MGQEVKDGTQKKERKMEGKKKANRRKKGKKKEENRDRYLFFNAQSKKKGNSLDSSETVKRQYDGFFVCLKKNLFVC